MAPYWCIISGMKSVPQADIDLERAIHDPVYRREVIRRLNRERSDTAKPKRPSDGESGPSPGHDAPTD